MMDWTALASLVTKIQSGQTEAWGELYERITPYIFSRTRYLLRNEADAEDATQETLIEIYKSINNLSDPQAFGGWVKTITLRRCYRYYGKPTEEGSSSVGLSVEDTEVIDFIDDRQPTPTEQIEAQETKDNLRQMIDSLPELQRETMILFYYDNLKIREIAEFMGCSENTVKSRLNYAKRTMEAEISEKRKKGILFPAIMPWTLIFRQLFTDVFEEQAEQVGSEVVQRIGENVASEIRGIEGTEGLGGSEGAGGSGGMEGTGDNVGTRATTSKGLTVATKAIIGIVAAVVMVAGVIILPNISQNTQEPVTDSDYAHIYYDYIQEELKPTGNFIDADMVYMDDSQMPLLITSGYSLHPKVNELQTSYSIYEYNKENKQVEHVYTAFSNYRIDPSISSYSHLLLETDGKIHIGFIVERQDGTYTIETSEGTEERSSRASVQLLWFEDMFTETGYNPSGTSDVAADYSYYADGNDSPYTSDEIQAIIDCRIGTWGTQDGEAVYFPIEIENTNGERLKDYFDD